MTAPEHTALLVMDVQSVVVDTYVTDNGILARYNAAIAHARSQGMMVVFVAVNFRSGHPEVSPRNKSFSRMRGTGRLVAGTAGAGVHPALDRSEGDLLVLKRRVSAFAGSDLELILRAHDITHLVLSGIATSGVVLSTLREAADRDYALTVLSDACADTDPRLHDMLLGTLFPRQATVTTVAGWTGADSG